MWLLNVSPDPENQHTVTSITGSPMEEFTTRQIAEHSSPEDAWLVIHGQGKSQVMVDSAINNYITDHASL